MSEHIKVRLDSATIKWFTEHPFAIATTVTQCEKCGLFYKLILGHSCPRVARHNSKPTQVYNKFMEEILKEKL